MIKIKFLGACGTVTGSKFLLTINEKNLLIDCGLFQGDFQTKQKNWEELPFDLKKLDGVILTHAHIDHAGYVPVLYKKGFEKEIYCTSATKALLHILLPDAGQLQEEEAKYAKKVGYTKHKDPAALFTEKDARNCLKLLKSIKFYESFEIFPGISFRFLYAGHILGAGILEIKVKVKKNKYLRIIFSGDLGRKKHVILKSPDFYEKADFLIIESTYGDRLHRDEDVLKRISEIIKNTFNRGGIVLIPAFAVDRTEQVIYYLSEAINEKLVDKEIKVYVDSPMALDALNLYKQFHSEYNENFLKIIKEKNPFYLPNLNLIRTVEESKKLNNLDKPCIIIAASGMCNGGRIEHHLKYKLPDEKNTILFVGYQAEGTKGRRILDGEEIIKIHGEEIPVRAKVEKINALSSHADFEEILWWQENSGRPKKVFIVHGADVARENLALRFKERFGFETIMPGKIENGIQKEPIEYILYE